MAEHDAAAAFSGDDAPLTSDDALAAYEAGVPDWAGAPDDRGRWAPVDLSLIHI